MNLTGLGMKTISLSALVGLIVVLLALLAWALVDAPPNTRELDADLTQVRNDIKQATADDSKYAAGMIKAMIELRLQILKQTEAMLVQRKASLLRRIAMSYSVDGHESVRASNSDLNEIIADLEQAERKLQQSSANAQRFSGGLAQAMALVTVETDQLSVSQLRLKFYAAKHGLPFLVPTTSPEKSIPPPKSGTVVKDRDAL
jgi:hypothetical protein